MMSIGHCTQREPQLLRRSLFGCSVCFQSFSPTTFVSCSKTVDVHIEAPWCNGSKERSDCKKSWDTTAISSIVTIRRDEETPPPTRRDFLRWLRHELPGALFKYTVVRFNITVVTWPGIPIFHEFIIHESNWRYVLLTTADCAVSKLLVLENRLVKCPPTPA